MSDTPSPTWNDLYTRLGAEMMPWGPPLPDGDVIEVAESFAGVDDNGEPIASGGGFEAEYAAIRQRVGVLHLPQRAILQLTGADVKDYLHRLCTQEINKLEGGQTVRAFQLDEKGHIAADIIVHHGDDSTWLEMDVFDLPWVEDLIEARLFAEDVTIEDWTSKRSVLWLLGPSAVRLLTAAAVDQDRVTRMGSMPGTHHVIDLRMNGGAVAHATAYRWDLGGVLGVRVAVPSEHALETYGALLVKAGYEIGAEVNEGFAQRRRDSMRGRPVGWSAFNTVRIEEGVPRYHIDFGRNSLPAEVPGDWGIDGAVSFTKGCYLGQEVVARMKSLGHPKKMLVGLKVADSDPEAAMELPGVAGAQVLEPGEKEKIIGGVTSSTASPLRGQAGIGMAVVRWGRHKPGTKVMVPSGGRLIEAEVVELGDLVSG
ncbi:MAG: glycine cleavage T C-terminal barrel domain-containing protein [Planctomycetota bacterium]